MEDAQKKQLIYHELGHCELERTHTNSRDSIMWPYGFSDYRAENFNFNPEPYVKELFDEGKAKFPQKFIDSTPPLDQFEGAF